MRHWYYYERLEKEPSIARRSLYRETDRAPSKSQNIRSYVEPQPRQKLVSENERFRTPPTQVFETPARSNRGRSAAVRPPQADGRLHHPQGMNRPALTVYGSPAVLVGSRAAGRFARHNQVVPCVERVIRKEVLFAKRLAGKGYRSPHRRNPYSNVWC